MGLVNGEECWCGDLLPPADSKVGMGECDTDCSGYDTEKCMSSVQLLMNL